MVAMVVNSDMNGLSGILRQADAAAVVVAEVSMRRAIGIEHEATFQKSITFIVVSAGIAIAFDIIQLPRVSFLVLR